MSQTLGLARGPPTHPHQMQVVDSRGGVESPLTLEGEVADVAINSEDATIPGVMLTDQGSDPAEPSAGYTIIYTKAGVLYVRSTAGIWQPLVNPMEAAADLIVGGAAGALSRLAKGSDGQVLTVDPATHLLVWADPTGGAPTDGVLLRRSTAQTIAQYSDTTVSFDVEDRDDGGLHEGVTHPDRVTAVEAGWYLAQGMVDWAVSATGARWLAVYRSDGAPVAQNNVPALSGITVRQSVTGLTYLEAGQYVTLNAYQSTAGNLDLIVSGGYPPRFHVKRLT